MSNWQDRDDEDGEEEKDEEYENECKNTEDRIIFLIDARAEMFEKNRLGERAFENCLKVVLAVMKSKIITSEKSSIGLIFFGTVSVHSLFNLII